MTRTKVERLIETGHVLDVDSSEFDGWGEPSVIFPEGYTFGGTGSTNSRLHITRYSKTDYAGYDSSALCGVGVIPAGPQTFYTLVERDMCAKCLTALEKEPKT